MVKYSFDFTKKQIEFIIELINPENSNKKIEIPNN